MAGIRDNTHRPKIIAASVRISPREWQQFKELCRRRDQTVSERLGKAVQRDLSDDGRPRAGRDGGKY